MEEDFIKNEKTEKRKYKYAILGVCTGADLAFLPPQHKGPEHAMQTVDDKQLLLLSHGRVFVLHHTHDKVRAGTSGLRVRPYALSSRPARLYTLSAALPSLLKGDANQRSKLSHELKMEGWRKLRRAHSSGSSFCECWVQ